MVKPQAASPQRVPSASFRLPSFLSSYHVSNFLKILKQLGTVVLVGLLQGVIISMLTYMVWQFATNPILKSIGASFIRFGLNLTIAALPHSLAPFANWFMIGVPIFVCLYPFVNSYFTDPVVPIQEGSYKNFYYLTSSWVLPISVFGLCLNGGVAFSTALWANFWVSVAAGVVWAAVDVFLPSMNMVRDPQNLDREREEEIADVSTASPSHRLEKPDEAEELEQLLADKRKAYLPHVQPKAPPLVVRDESSSLRPVNKSTGSRIHQSL